MAGGSLINCVSMFYVTVLTYTKLSNFQMALSNTKKLQWKEGKVDYTYINGLISQLGVSYINIKHASKQKISSVRYSIK